MVGVVAQPITYEDFLPVSAAGIFQSNLGNERRHAVTVMPVAKHLSRRWVVRFWMSSSFIRKRKNAVNVAVVCFKF
ncbi:2-oxoadipate dioxygenase/decarboxylase family protein [Escherichia coli]